MSCRLGKCGRVQGPLLSHWGQEKKNANNNQLLPDHEEFQENCLGWWSQWDALQPGREGEKTEVSGQQWVGASQAFSVVFPVSWSVIPAATRKSLSWSPEKPTLEWKPVQATPAQPFQMPSETEGESGKCREVETRRKEQVGASEMQSNTTKD